MVSYINKQGGVVSKTLNNETYALYEWAIPRSLRLQAIHQAGINNKLADSVTESLGSHRVASQSADCAASVLDVGEAPGVTSLSHT